MPNCLRTLVLCGYVATAFIGPALCEEDHVVKALLDRASNGDPTARYLYSASILTGGSQLDDKAGIALRYLRDAAASGMTQAQTLLGACLLGSCAVNPSFENVRAGAAWLRAAERGGDSLAAYMLGVAAYQGQIHESSSLQSGTPMVAARRVPFPLGASSSSDFAAAKVHFERASSHSSQPMRDPTIAPTAGEISSSSRFYLGVMHEYGLGSQQDAKKALNCYDGAARSGHQTARLYASLMRLYGRGVRQQAREAAVALRSLCQAPVAAPFNSLMIGLGNHVHGGGGALDAARACYQLGVALAQPQGAHIGIDTDYDGAIDAFIRAHGLALTSERELYIAHGINNSAGVQAGNPVSSNRNESLPVWTRLLVSDARSLQQRSGEAHYQLENLLGEAQSLQSVAAREHPLASYLHRGASATESKVDERGGGMMVLAKRHPVLSRIADAVERKSAGESNSWSEDIGNCQQQWPHGREVPPGVKWPSDADVSELESTLRKTQEDAR